MPTTYMMIMCTQRPRKPRDSLKREWALIKDRESSLRRFNAKLAMFLPDKMTVKIRKRREAVVRPEDVRILTSLLLTKKMRKKLRQ